MEENNRNKVARCIEMRTEKQTKKPAKSAKRQAGGKFAKGCSGNPAGPKVGTKKKKTVLLEAILEEHSFDPVEALIAVYKKDETEDALKVKIAAEIMGYVYPKRKAVEHSGSLGGGKTEEEMTDAELEQIVNS